MWTVLLENITLSEISQSQKDKSSMIPLIRGLSSTQIYRNSKKNGGSGAGEGGERSCFMGIELAR